jgi:hypothetical protein
VNTRQRFAEKWSPRIGQKAARLAATAYLMLAISGLVVPVWGILLVTSNTTLNNLGYVLCGLDIALFVIGMTYNHRVNRSLSEHLGTKVSSLNSPTLRDGQYEAWCHRHHITSAS